MAGALQPFWLTHGYWSEGRRWFGRSDEHGGLGRHAASGRARQGALRGGRALQVSLSGNFARARMLCDQSLALYRALADPSGVVDSLVELSRISSFQSDQTATQAFLAEAASMLEKYL